MEPTYITEEGRQEERRRLLISLTKDYFGRVSGAYFVVVGSIKSVRHTMFKLTLSELEIHKISKPRIVHFKKLHLTNIGKITSAACSPSCVGVVAFGLTLKQKELMESNFKKARVWDEHYNIFSEEEVVTSKTLQLAIIQILEVLFEDDLESLGP